MSNANSYITSKKLLKRFAEGGALYKEGYDPQTKEEPLSDEKSSTARRALDRLKDKHRASDLPGYGEGSTALRDVVRGFMGEKPIEPTNPSEMFRIAQALGAFPPIAGVVRRPSGAAAALRKLLQAESPRQFAAAKEALRRSYHTGYEHSVVGLTHSGGPGKIVTSGDRTRVKPSAEDVSRAVNDPQRRDIVDFHTHPSDVSGLRVSPSTDDVAFYADYEQGYLPRTLKIFVASPPSTGGGRTSTAYSFFETDVPHKIYDKELFKNVELEIQEAGHRGRFDRVRRDPAFAEAFESGAVDLPSLLGEAAPLLLLERRAAQGLGRQKLDLGANAIAPNAELRDFYEMIREPAQEVLKKKKLKKGGEVSTNDFIKDNARSSEVPELDERGRVVDEQEDIASESRRMLNRVLASQGRVYDDPIRSGRPLLRKGREKGTPESNEALVRALSQGVANMPYNILGAPGDIANILALPTGRQPFYGSEATKEAFTRAGIRPKPPTDPTARAIYNVADVGSALINPAAPVRAAAEGAGAVAKGASLAGREMLRELSRTNELGQQAGVIKPKGGNWIRNYPERQLKRLEYTEGVEQNDAINNWINTRLNKYIKNEMGTPEDPLRKLAERNISILPEDTPRPDILDFIRERQGFPVEGMGASELAKTWEDLVDNAINIEQPKDLFYALDLNKQGPPIYNRLGELVPSFTQKLIDANPWLKNIDPETPLYSLNKRNFEKLNFDHLIDELRNATTPDSGLPQSLQLSLDKLQKVTVPQAVELVDKINKWRAEQQVAANLKKAQNAATFEYKAYDTIPGTTKPNKRGLRWVELRTPEITSADQLTPEVKDRYQMYLNTGGGEEAALRQAAKHDKSLAEALKYEGDVMGHCVGGYCPDVIEGRSRIYSLRDNKGEPHVTVEVLPNPQPYPISGEEFAKLDLKTKAEYREYVRQWRQRHPDVEDLTDEHVAMALAEAGVPPRPPIIEQIKGKANRAPKDEYLPFVQDFVRSGQWSRVEDLQNTGLFQVPKGRKLPGFSKEIEPGFYTIEDFKKMAIENDMPKEILDSWIKALQDQRRFGYAQGGPVDVPRETSTSRKNLDTLTRISQRKKA